MAEIFFLMESQGLFVPQIFGLYPEATNNVPEGAKSNCWILICRCWSLTSILTFKMML